MLLVAEIILTIFAWRKGWRWLGLLPLGVCILVGLLLGMAIGAAGGTADSATGVGIVLDIIAIIALIVMVSVGPKKSNEIIDIPKNV